MKEYEVTFSITGRASVIIKAESEEEAKKKFKKYQIEDGSEELIHWESDEIELLTVLDPIEEKMK